MTHGDSLALTVEATQRSLEERLGEVLAPHRDPDRPRDDYAAIDAFLAATSRHLGAIQEVLLAQAHRTVPDGDGLIHDYVAVARDLEQTLSLVKARLYGEAHAIHLGWPELWVRVHTQLTEHNSLETRLVGVLIQHCQPEVVDGLARRIFDAETHGPTRPHPVLPHTGPLGKVSRRMWAVADRFWDNAEGRVIPEPVHPAPHTHDSLMGQYLLADPKFDDHAKLMEHRHHLPHRHPKDTAEPEPEPEPEPRA